MGQAHGIAKPQDLVVAELDDPIAGRAVQVVMSGVAIIVFECASVGEPEFAEQTGFDEEPQRPVDSRTADALTGVMQVADQLVGIEVLVGMKDMVDQHAPALGQFLTANLQELAKLLDRGVGDGVSGSPEWASALAAQASSPPSHLLREREGEARKRRWIWLRL